MSQWIKRQIRDHFGFSKTETNGVLVLCVLIMVFFTVPLVFRWYENKQVPKDPNTDAILLDSLVQELEQQINHFPSTDSTTKKNGHANVYEIQPFDINTADIIQLRKIKGIGMKLAQRIMKYRDQLGGFISQHQYQEVYGLNKVVLEKLSKFTYIAPDFQPRYLPINTADFKTLVAHPYLNDEQVKKLIQYRNKHGPFNKLEDLISFDILDPSTFLKMKDYLKK